MRRGEAAALQWRELDLDHEVVRLDENKTDSPRWWRLGPGVADALAAWRNVRGEVGPDELVFTARPAAVARPRLVSARRAFAGA